jgi:hypothetical protein
MAGPDQTQGLQQRHPLRASSAQSAHPSWPARTLRAWGAAHSHLPAVPLQAPGPCGGDQHFDKRTNADNSLVRTRS